MKKLLEFLLEQIAPDTDFVVEEKTENEYTTLIIKAPKDKLGLIIGKGGNTIKSIRNLLKIKATLEKVGVSVQIEEA